MQLEIRSHSLFLIGLTVNRNVEIELIKACSNIKECDMNGRNGLSKLDMRAAVEAL